MALLIAAGYHYARLQRPRLFKDRQNPLDTDDDHSLIQQFRFPRVIIFELIHIFTEDHPFVTQRSHAIHPTLQTLVALRYFATGSQFRLLGDRFGISKSSVSRIVKRFALSIFNRRNNFIHFDAAEIHHTSIGFSEIANFPNVCGCIDGSQFAIKSPSIDEPAYVNRKGFHSINGQAICSADFTFSDIVIRYPGSTHDAFIFRFSGISQRFQQNEFGESWLLGDSGYPNLPYLLVPLANPVTPAERAYNRAHKKTRVTIERSFGILKSRFMALSHKLSGPLLFTPDIACRIIVCCCCLHNIARRANLPDPEEIENDVLDEAENGLQNILGLNYAAVNGEAVRARLIAQRFGNV
ncbi:UNVERIFIED_CONTAM: hypothetical protein GTU68_002657 [Idotea baltica]|nr:hypothetical protein [Idotea baltica]